MIRFGSKHNWLLGANNSAGGNRGAQAVRTPHWGPASLSMFDGGNEQGLVK